MSPPPYIGGVGNQVIIHPLREEVVTSLKSVREVIQRGEANRRTASTDWNERSSRSHSVFRLVVESRERGSPDDTAEEEERKVSWECCIWVPMFIPPMHSIMLCHKHQEVRDCKLRVAGVSGRAYW